MQFFTVTWSIIHCTVILITKYMCISNNVYYNYLSCKAIFGVYMLPTPIIFFILILCLVLVDIWSVIIGQTITYTCFSQLEGRLAMHYKWTWVVLGFFWCKIIDKFICHFECHLLHYIKRKKIKSRIIWKNFLSCNRKSEEKFLIVTGNLSSISIIYYHIYIPNICLSVKTISKSTLVKAPPPFHTHTRKKIKQKNNIIKISKSKQIIKKDQTNKQNQKKKKTLQTDYISLVTNVSLQNAYLISSYSLKKIGLGIVKLVYAETVHKYIE